MVIFRRPGDTGHEIATKFVTAVNQIDGIDDADIEELGSEIVVEWNMPDPDFKFPSVVTIRDNDGRIAEAVLRFGHLGTRNRVDRRELDNIKGDWVDVVLTAGQRADVIDKLGRRSADLGDAYISEKIRPHVRFHRKEDGYDLPIQDFVDFIREIVQMFRTNYGDLQGRMMDPEFADNYRQ